MDFRLDKKQTRSQYAYGKREDKEHLRQEVEREEEVEHNNGEEIKESQCEIKPELT